MKAEDNDFLTQVEAGTPMGEYLRSHWVPVMRSARVEAGGRRSGRAFLPKISLCSARPMAELG